MRKITALLAGLFITSTAFADLTPFKDYDIGEDVVSVTTIKVDSNMIDRYLEGLRATWATSNDTAKSLGQIKDYAIYVSQLPASGDFNVILVVTVGSADQLQPSEAKFDAFMKAWGDENEKRSGEIVETYPDIRKITGEYMVRKITFK